MAKGNGQNYAEVCPMCESPFDSGRFRLVTCVDCGAEGSTACCMDSQGDRPREDVRCHKCEDES